MAINTNRIILLTPIESVLCLNSKQFLFEFKPAIIPFNFKDSVTHTLVLDYGS